MHLAKPVLAIFTVGLAFAASVLPGTAAEKLRLSIATGGTGGVYYPFGGGLARVLSKYAPNLQVTAEVTGGSVDNIKLIGAGDADIGLSTIDSAVDAVKGSSSYSDVGPQKIAAIALLYDSYVHVVARAGAHIATVGDMKGKRISVGSAGSSTENIADRLLAAAGLDPKRAVTRENLSVAESAGAIKDGKIDAFFWIGGLPTSAVSDLAITGPSKIVFVATDRLKPKLDATYPGLYRLFTLPKATYAGVTKDIGGLGVANVLVVSSTMKAETVTTILKTIFDHLAEVQKIHPEGANLTLAGAAKRTALALHPAAAAFYAARRTKP
jgi:TRAP transporter TAXI family solute receptor